MEKKKITKEEALAIFNAPIKEENFVIVPKEDIDDKKKEKK